MISFRWFSLEFQEYDGTMDWCTCCKKIIENQVRILKLLQSKIVNVKNTEWITKSSKAKAITKFPRIRRFIILEGFCNLSDQSGRREIYIQNQALRDFHSIICWSFMKPGFRAGAGSLTFSFDIIFESLLRPWASLEGFWSPPTEEASWKEVANFKFIYFLVFSKFSI